MDRKDDIQRIFDLQKHNYRGNKSVSYEVRIDRLNRVEKLFHENHEEMILALKEDFGTRDTDMAFMGDIMSPIANVQVIRRKLKWMKPEKPGDGFMRLFGQKTYIMHEPLGVVGVITPFNAPITLAFDPAIDAIGAGNSVMMRFPEATPRTGALMARLVAQYFDPSELAVVTGELEVARFFAALPWDMLAFTGGAATARHIMAAAAQNLTPVLLELGGKSPVVVLQDADLKVVARKTIKTRLMNGGQVCIAGDYALVHETQLDRFLELAQEATREVYPTILDNDHYTSVVGDDAFDRLNSYISEARARGSKIIEVIPKGEALPDPKTRKFPLTMVVNPAPDLRLPREEIFGPILPVLSYRSLDDALEIINAREKPLALYVHGKDRASIHRVLAETSAGGVTVNDFLMHAGSHSMGFGGVGQSGMGRYKGGKVGFKAFSNPKSVFEQGIMGRMTLGFLPPINSARTRKILKSRVGIK